MRLVRLVRELPVAAFLLLWLLLVASQPAAGQILDTPRGGIGFVANAPEEMAGVGGYILLPLFGGIGFYVDGKIDIDSPADDRAFLDDVTSADLEAEGSQAVRFLRGETSWRGFNAGLIRPLNPFLMVYAGGGMAQGERYKLYEELTGDIGRAMWVRDPDEDEDRLNLMFGLILRLVPTFSTQIGVETQPRGFTAGVSLRLPPW
jgi:hypothetical protein